MSPNWTPPSAMLARALLRLRFALGATTPLAEAAISDILAAEHRSRAIERRLAPMYRHLALGPGPRCAANQNERAA
jgi:hypothetical protein